mgnify:CR=1 FL=1
MFALLLFACNDTLLIDQTGDYNSLVGPDEGGDTADTEALDAEWSDATLRIETPTSASFLPLGEPHTFKATVYGADGEPKDFPDITWASDIDTDWALVGQEMEDSTLSSGIHSLTAEARLPNGDRLASTIGGVLVQSIYAGVYVGELQVTAAGEYNGQEIAVGCAGPLTMVVDAEGEVATGDAGCLISLLGYDLDTTYVFDLGNDMGDITGEAAIDLTLFQYGVETTGSLSEDGELEGTFAADVYGYLALEAVYTASLLTRDLSTVE